ncbi:hypothetical protein D3C76_1309560 [compost metagenome]
MVPPANSTWAMGTPVARLFFEPQKMMVMQSSRENPRRRPSWLVVSSARASSTQQATTSPASAGSGISCHSPWITAALKAVYTTSRIEPWST